MYIKKKDRILDPYKINLLTAKGHVSKELVQWFHEEEGELIKLAYSTCLDDALTNDNRQHILLCVYNFCKQYDFNINNV